MTDTAKVRALLDEGLTHYGLGEVSKALEIWSRVLELDPSNVRAKEYVRFVKENWAPQDPDSDGAYRPDEGTDPNRTEEDGAVGQVGSSSDPEETQLKPEEVPLPDDSGFVPPVKPIANLWGDLYDFGASSSEEVQAPPATLFAEQEPTVPAENPPVPSVLAAADALFSGNEETTVESNGMPVISAEQASLDVAENSDEHPDEQPGPAEQLEQTPAKRDVETIMSSTLPPRPAEPENFAFDSPPLQPFPAQEASHLSERFPVPESSLEKEDASESVLPSEDNDSSGKNMDTSEQAPQDKSGVVINPVPPFAEADFDEPSALSLVGIEEQESSTEIEAPEVHTDSSRSMLKGARDLLEIDDFSGALEILEKILEQSPDEPEALGMKKEAEASLLAILKAKLGDLEQSPEVCMPGDEIIWLNLDNRAGFVLSLVDGNTAYEDILSLCGLSRLDGMRILSQLVHDKVIHVT